MATTYSDKLIKTIKVGDSAHYLDASKLGGQSSSYYAAASDIPTEYIKSASVSDNILTLTPNDSSDITFIGGKTYGLSIDGSYINIVEDSSDVSIIVPFATAALTDNDGSVISETYVKTVNNIAPVNGNVSIGAKDVSAIAETIEISYADLVSLRNNSELTPGQQYQITDYICTTVSDDTQAASNTFDILVIADSSSSLNEDAKARLHDSDTYFASSKLDAWELKYCLDNDSNRFAWADSTNGKGVIYYMKDEWENECPYDFKNIQFKRYKITASTQCPSAISTYLNSSTSFATDSGNILTCDPDDHVWRYTFDSNEADSNGDASDATLVGGSNNISRNNISSFIESGVLYLNNIVMFGTDNYDNKIGNDCHDITFGSECYSNKFDDNCTYIIFGNECDTNTFGSHCQTNIFDGVCYYNKFGKECYYNIFGNKCYSNTLGDNCYSNAFGDTCIDNAFDMGSRSNIFGNNCYANRLGAGCYSNTLGSYSSYNIFDIYCFNNIFGGGCEYNKFGNASFSNTFGNACSGNTFMSGCSYNIFGNHCMSINFEIGCLHNIIGSDSSNAINYCKAITIESLNQYIHLICSDASASYSNYLQNVHICQGVNNSNSEITVTIPDRNLAYKTIVAKNPTSGIIEIYPEQKGLTNIDVSSSATGDIVSNISFSGETLTVTKVNGADIFSSVTYIFE